MLMLGNCRIFHERFPQVHVIAANGQTASDGNNIKQSATNDFYAGGSLGVSIVNAQRYGIRANCGHHRSTSLSPSFSIQVPWSCAWPVDTLCLVLSVVNTVLDGLFLHKAANDTHVRIFIDSFYTWCPLYGAYNSKWIVSIFGTNDY